MSIICWASASAASFVAANEEAVAATLEKAMEAVRANKGA